VSIDPDRPAGIRSNNRIVTDRCTAARMVGCPGSTAIVRIPILNLLICVERGDVETVGGVDIQVQAGIDPRPDARPGDVMGRAP
jgi:hypothetical protein